MMQLSREERMLDVKSMTNVRDLGGYETQTGFYTKSHKFIRSTNPSRHYQMMRKNIFMIMELECK